MTDLGQYQTGTLKSMPKVTAVKADGGSALVYKNVGNNHNYPFIWADTFIMAAGTSEVTLASGITFHGHKLADEAACSITFSPYGNPGSGNLYVDCDSENNVVKIKSTASMSGDLTIKVHVLLGMDADIDKLSTRGNKGAMPTYP